MNDKKWVFICSKCGCQDLQWSPQCLYCGEWNTYNKKEYFSIRIDYTTFDLNISDKKSMCEKSLKRIKAVEHFLILFGFLGNSDFAFANEKVRQNLSDEEKRIEDELFCINHGFLVSGRRLYTYFGKSPFSPFVAIPNSITLIDDNAFDSGSRCTSLTIPKSVVSIGNDAFKGCCISLETIKVESNNPRFHSDGNCLIETESKELKLGCKNSVIPTDGSVVSIGDRAFFDCYGLTNITIPNGVTSIGYESFLGCTNLETITIPNTVVNIDARIFEACNNYFTILCSESSPIFYRLMRLFGEHIKTYEAQRREKCVCQYCGGKFSGIFKKVCSDCGKGKDY